MRRLLAMVLVWLAAPGRAESMWFPARQEGVVVAATVRAAPTIFIFPAYGLVGGLGALEASASWQASAPFAVRLQLWPLTGATYQGSPLVGVLNASLSAAWDADLLGLGLGVGVTAPLGRPLYAPIPAPWPSFLVAPLARVGAADGLCLSAQFLFVLGKENGAYPTNPGRPFGLWLSGVEVVAQVPVGKKAQLQLRGGAPSLRPEALFGLAELGFRFALDPQLERSRVFLRLSLGVAVGPLVSPSFGVGFDWRL